MRGREGGGVEAGRTHTLEDRGRRKGGGVLYGPVDSNLTASMERGPSL